VNSQASIRWTASRLGRDYRETVFLPDTPFPMRAACRRRSRRSSGLGEVGRRPLRRAAQGAAGAGAPLFVLHDGPPYANGNIHIGHALNKT
jgi:isoleucyl-tRNA synthetase